MFLRYFVELQVPVSVVEEALLDTPERWIPGLAEEAGRRGESLLSEVGFGNDEHRVDKRVEIELGPPVRMASKTILPLTWRAKGAAVLFPILDADIEVAPLGPHRTQLSVSARYKPPLGMIGRGVDRAVMHRVAEATVKDFLDRAGESLVRLVPASG